jgi:hypothetical protein
MRAMLTALDDGVAFLLLASLNVPIVSVYVACDDLISNSKLLLQRGSGLLCCPSEVSLSCLRRSYPVVTSPAYEGYMHNDLNILG